MIEEGVFSEKVICKAMDFCIESFSKRTGGRIYTIGGLAKDTAFFLNTLNKELYKINE